MPRFRQDCQAEDELVGPTHNQSNRARRVAGKVDMPAEEIVLLCSQYERHVCGNEYVYKSGDRPATDCHGLDCV